MGGVLLFVLTGGLMSSQYNFIMIFKFNLAPVFPSKIRSSTPISALWPKFTLSFCKSNSCGEYEQMNIMYLLIKWNKGPRKLFLSLLF